MRHFQVVLALLAVAACGRTKDPTASSSRRGVEDLEFTVEVRGEMQFFDPSSRTTFMLPGRGMVTGAGIRCGLEGTGTLADPVVVGTTCEVAVVRGTTVQLTATPDAPDYASLEWAGACSGIAATCSVTVDADRLVLVRFAQTQSGLGGHPDHSDPAVHGPEYRKFESGAPDAWRCTDCHGTALTGQGISPSCAQCHGNPLLGPICLGCHGVPPPNGSHRRHFGVAAPPTYGGTGTASTLGGAGAGYAFDCGNCHPLDRAKHRDGIVQVELHDPAAPVDSVKARNPADAAYAPGTTPYPGDAAPFTGGTCASVYCHSALAFDAAPVPRPRIDFPFDGAYPVVYPEYVVTVTRTYSSPRWVGETLGCTGCHGMPSRSVYPANDGGAGDSHLWIDRWGYGNLHGFGHVVGPVGCATCHYDTVTDQGSRRLDGMDVPVYDDVPMTGHAAHVNGRADVRFTDEVIAFGSSGRTFSASGGGGPAPRWEPDGKTCADVSCHRGQTSVRWGTPYRWENSAECNVCHGH